MKFKIKFTSVHDGLFFRFKPSADQWTTAIKVPKELEKGLQNVEDKDTWDALSYEDEQWIEQLLERWFKSNHKPWIGTITTEIKGVYIVKETDN